MGFDPGRLTCSTGNIISYFTRRGLPGAPTVIFESGLMHTSVAWLLVSEHLDPSISVVVYDRAGYRRSLRRCAEEYCLGESVSDLTDLVAKVSDRSGPTYLVGHSLGGYLVHRAAARENAGHDVATGRSIDGVVLVDPTHPRELAVSRGQREGARSVNATMKVTPGTILLGGGLLVDKRAVFAYAEGSPYYQQLRYEASAFGCVQAAQREWNYSYRFLLDGGRPLEPVSVPVAVIAAGATMEHLREQKALYEEFLASGSGGGLTTIPETTHLSITGSPDHAPSTAAMIESLVTAWSAGSALSPTHEAGVLA